MIYQWLKLSGLLSTLIVLSSPALSLNDPVVIEAAGTTMGTTYSVKIYNPSVDLAKDWREQIDSELRRVNDQMSTYIDTSEISRFNRSESLEWFEVSPETAMVVEKAIDLNQMTAGAFDITVAELVKLWGFGGKKQVDAPPDETTISLFLKNVGSSGLAVRLVPPAIRKSNPQLSIDLSAIAKGHGVDRVVHLLTRMGETNIFVEIGGEIRTMGSKGGTPWTVGIQLPDATGNVAAFAYPLTDKAIATSGDYRNFFEYEGVRYSHTIDPRSGKPVSHDFASVSVVADDCMTADGWATALNVLGPEKAFEVAATYKLEVLIIRRQSDGNYRAIGTGSFQVDAKNTK